MEDTANHPAQWADFQTDDLMEGAIGAECDDDTHEVNVSCTAAYP